METASGASQQASPAPVEAAQTSQESTDDECGAELSLWGFRPPVLMYTVFSLMVIVFGLWILFTWTGYADRYSQANEGWGVGSTKSIEVTLIREDKETLGCSSDLVFEGNRCGFDAKGNRVEGVTEAQLLRPYNTVRNELFVAANLWTSLGIDKPLPKERFSAVCDFHVKGVAKRLGVRWSKTGRFDPVKRSVAVGTLTNCVIPQ